MPQHLTEQLTRADAEALDRLAKRFVEGCAEGMQEGDEAVFEYEPLSRVEAIEHLSRDGFSSWNSGGYEVCLPAYLYSAWSSGTCPGPILPAIQAGNRGIADEWERQHPERPPFLECVCASEGEPGHEWQEAAHEWEMAGWSGDDDCYYWKARAVYYAPNSPQNTTGEAEVYLDAYLCTDSYGRDSIGWLSAYGAKADQTEGGFKLTLRVSNFVRLSEEQLDRMVKVALRKLPSFVNCG